MYLENLGRSGYEARCIFRILYVEVEILCRFWCLYVILFQRELSQDDGDNVLMSKVSVCSLQCKLVTLSLAS